LREPDSDMTTEQPSDSVTLLPLTEAAERLGVSVEAVQKYIADGKLETRLEDSEPRVIWTGDENSTPLVARHARHSGDDPKWLVPSMIIGAIMLFVIAVVMLVYFTIMKPRF
jgi:hypothetical protein